jgi:hypothetical protein
MSEFKPVDIKKYLQTPIKVLDKTDKTGFVSFVKPNLPVIEPEKKDDASLTLEAQIEKSTRVDAEPADPRTATAVPVLTELPELSEPAQPDKHVSQHASFTDLAVSFLEATERILVTWKDERPPVLRTPQLKRELAAVENALSAYRAVLLPDAPESRAVGESLADRYGPERR